ncbi:MAG: IS200/IS605 family transposase [Candidatus Aminicenantales bacterium]
MGIKRTSHSVYDTSYHLVWCPKYRKKIFERMEVRERAEQMIREICEAYDIEILEMELLEEHIHLLVSFPPSRSIGEVVRIVKSNSGRGLFREFPGLKKRLWGGELWEDGYFARTVGDRMTRDVIARYIEHHRDLEQGPAQLALKLRS